MSSEFLNMNHVDLNTNNIEIESISNNNPSQLEGLDIIIQPLFRFLMSNLDIERPHEKLQKNKSEVYSVSRIIQYIILGIAIIHCLYLILMLIKQNCLKKRNEEGENNNLKKIHDTCCICMDEIKNEVQLLCSHSYCAGCISEYARQRYSFINVCCPYCRSPSRLMIIKFELNDENRNQYEDILKYNNDFTTNWKTSLCLCIDTLRFFSYYTKQILDFNNARYVQERGCLICMMCLCFCVIILPVGKLNNWIDIFLDICFYLLLCCSFSELFFRNERRRNQENIQNFEINNSFVSNVNNNAENNGNNNNIDESIDSQLQRDIELAINQNNNDNNLNNMNNINNNVDNIANQENNQGNNNPNNNENPNNNNMNIQNNNNPEIQH